MLVLAITAGLLATCGSLFCKLSGIIIAESLLQWILKLFLIGAMLILNTAGCTCFVKSLQGCESSLPGTIACSASNYLFSAIFGFLIFNESTSWDWWCGISLVLLGLIIIQSSPSEKEKTS